MSESNPRFGSIRWSTSPSHMTVRIEGLMVHRVFELMGTDVRDDEAVLECGVRAPMNVAVETHDPVDCMGCLLRRATEAMEAVLAEYEEAYP